MASKTINIKDNYVPELIEVFGVGYKEEMSISKTQFANEQFDKDVKDWIHTRVTLHRQEVSKQSIDNTKITE